MSWVQALQLPWPRLEPRSTGQIDADLDHEFAFHLEQLEHEFIEAGQSADEAKAAALARFGDVAGIKEQCKRIALEERIMLQRINAVLMVIVLVAVGFVSVQVSVTQRHHTTALQDMTDQLVGMKLDLAASRAAPEPAGDASTGPLALVEGEIDKPGWYPISNAPGQVTLLHNLLDAAGGITADQRVFVRRTQPDGTTSGSWRPGSRLLGPDPEKIVVRPNDEIRVAQTTPEARLGGPPLGPGQLPEPPGTWHEVDSDGEPVADGARLDLTSRDDVMNLTGSPMGTLHLPVVDAQLRVILRYAPQKTSNLVILDRVNEPGRRSSGRWKLEDGKLILNIAPAAPDIEELQSPLVFVKADE